MKICKISSRITCHVEQQYSNIIYIYIYCTTRLNFNLAKRNAKHLKNTLLEPKGREKKQRRITQTIYPLKSKNPTTVTISHNFVQSN